MFLSGILTIPPKPLPVLKLLLSVQGESGSARIIATGTEPMTSGTLGTLDPTMLDNGLYTLTLTAIDIGGHTSSTS